MKRVVLVLFFFLTYLSAFAQDSTEYKHGLKTNLLGAIGGQFQLTYEHAFKKNFSIQFSAGYISLNGIEGTDPNTKYEYGLAEQGFLIIPEVRKYFSRVLDKIYIGAFLRYKNTTLSFTDLSPKFPLVNFTQPTHTFGGGVLIGYQKVIGKSFLVDVFLGPQFKHEMTQDRSYAPTFLTDEDYNEKFKDADLNTLILGFFPDKKMISLRAGINFGFLF